MNEITNAECRELADRLGIKWKKDGEWHCQNCDKEIPDNKPALEGCIYCGCHARYFVPYPLEDQNPDFTDAREVLKVMMAREDYGAFMESLRQKADRLGIGSMAHMANLITTPGALLDAVAEFFRWQGE